MPTRTWSQAAQEQLERFSHTDFTVVPYEIYATLAERLLGLAPLAGPAKAAFFNAGTEAVENAVKFARAYTGRSAVIAFEGAFHGRTYLSLALTSKTHPYKAGLGPFAPEVYRVPFNEASTRCRAGVRSRRSSRPRTWPRSSSSRCRAREASSRRRRSSSQGVRAICDDHGIVMVCDEVQSGFARTGRFFAIEHFGVEPDLITVAKSIAMGIPLSGVLGKAAIMDAPQEGGVGGTYVGNPVAQAAALAVLDVIEDEGLVERSAAIGETIRARMLAWQERWPAIREVRGLGSMLAIELGAPDAEVASAVVQAAFQRGLLLLKAGVTGNSIRVLVPLVVGDAELDEALDAWEQALETAL